MEAEKDDIECNVDSEAIYKIISNLIANAIKYAKSQILITAKETNGNLQISIKDDGTGIENQYMEKYSNPSSRYKVRIMPYVQVPAWDYHCHNHWQ